MQQKWQQQLLKAVAQTENPELDCSSARLRYAPKMANLDR